MERIFDQHYASTDTRLTWSLGQCVLAAIHAHGPAEQLILLLAENPMACRWPSYTIARKLSVSRTTLYQQLRVQKMPPLEQIQYLFRLVPAARMIQQGVAAEEAAFRTSFADSTTLRKALRARLGVTLTHVRRQQDWQELVVGWLQIHRRKEQRCAD